MHTILRAVLAAALLASPLPASAQSIQLPLGDPSPPRVDLAGHAGWFAVDKTDVAPRWNSWYDVGEVGATGGVFLSRHLKAEVGVTTTGTADVYREVLLPTPSSPFGINYSQEQRYRATTLSGGASWQFFDNRWFHPLLGAGVEATRESVETLSLRYPPPVNPPPGLLIPPGTQVTWHARPYASGGFKWFVAERTFIRGDLRTSFGDGVAQTSLRVGVGVDF